MRKIIFLLGFLFILSGCQLNPKLNEIPSNITYDSTTDKITWTRINQATGYIVSINNQESEILENVYLLGAHDIGRYVIKVKAIYGDYTSNYSFPTTIVKTMTHEIGLFFGDVISCTPIQGVTDYRFEVFQDGTSVFLQNASINALEYQAFSGLLNVYVTAYFENFRIGANQIKVDLDQKVYPKNGEPFTIHLNHVTNEIYLNDERVDSKHYISSENSLVFTSSFINELEVGKYVLKLSGTVDYYTYLTISDPQ